MINSNIYRMEEMNNYEKFLKNKSQLSGNFGFEPNFMPNFLFDFQKYLVAYALRKGRAAVFAGTGLGKTAIQLAWAENVVRHTNKNVLILTPLAVSHQTIKEGAKFGIDVKRSRDGNPRGKITVTNYQQLGKFNPNDFIGCACDESSAIKNYSGATKMSVTRFMNKMPYRSLYTATPSPNDYIELGTSSEALGELTFMDMLSQFFRDTSNDKNPQWSTPKWEIKKHAVNDFWRWVSSWARAVRKPSDIGFDDTRFILPTLTENEHVLECTEPLPGEMFVRKARTLTQQRQERKLTINQRVQKVVELVEPHDISVIWCHYNYEGDLLTKAVPNAEQIAGSDSDEAKEEKFIAFSEGQIGNLVIKPKIGAFGLNWQHCNHMTMFPSHSYEQYYQSIRRCYRFGQAKPVTVDIVTTDGEKGVLENIRRKAQNATEMFSKLTQHMNNELKLKPKQYHNNKIEVPEWLNIK